MLVRFHVCGLGAFVPDIGGLAFGYGSTWQPEGSFQFPERSIGGAMGDTEPGGWPLHGTWARGGARGTAGYDVCGMGSVPGNAAAGYDVSCKNDRQGRDGPGILRGGESDPTAFYFLGRVGVDFVHRSHSALYRVLSNSMDLLLPRMPIWAELEVMFEPFCPVVVV